MCIRDSFTPSGRSIQAEGITPDITLSAVKLEQLDDDFVSIKEKDLTKHLVNTDSEEQKVEKEEKEEKPVGNDYPLHEALNLLKGINILRK